MPSSRRPPPRFRPVVRGAALLAALCLLTACGTTVAGSPEARTGAVPAGTTASSSSALTGQITQPSVLPGQSTTPTGPSAAATAPSTAPTTGTPPTTVTGKPPVPKGLESFYGQKLAWGKCAEFATGAAETRDFGSSTLECAYLGVPMVYAEPGGTTIKIGVLRKVATESSARIGSLVMNPGGPGASGMSFVSQVANYQLATELNAKFDLVGFDPRGIGSSKPLIGCQTDAELDATRAAPPRSDTPAAVAAANQQLKKYAGECVTTTTAQGKVDGKKFLANVGTRDVAKDIDVLRAVVGDTKLTYAGFSYGTRIGYVYAEQFPDNVRAMILDGAVDPDEDPATSLVDQEKGFQKAFETFAASCAQHASCALGADPSKATAAFQSLTRPLLRTPLKLPDGRVLSYGDATLGVAAALYSSESWDDLEAAIAGLAKGSGTGLMAFADRYYGRDSSGRYSDKPDSFNAIRCVDEPRMTDSADVMKLNSAQAAAAPFEDSGDPAANIPDLCAYWPVPPTLGPHRLHVPGLPQVLVISSTGDPATPYASGVDLAKQLGARLLTFEGTRHTAYLTGNSSCVDDAGNAYLIDLTLPAEGIRCR